MQLWSTAEERAFGIDICRILAATGLFVAVICKVQNWLHARHETREADDQLVKLGYPSMLDTRPWWRNISREEQRPSFEGTGKARLLDRQPNGLRRGK